MDFYKKSAAKEWMTNMKDKISISMLGHKRIPSREGGVEVVVEQLASRMVSMGNPVVCYNRKGHHVSGKEFDKKSLSEYKGIKIKSVPTFDFKGLAAMSSSFFAAVAAAFDKSDIVHFHAEGPCAMMWIPKLFGKRCIATIHGLDHRRAKWGNFARKYIMFGEKTAVRCADEIIVLSKGVQDYFRDTYGRETRIIPNGVNRPTIRKAGLIKEKFGLEKDGYVLFLGRIVPEKGLKYLIEAFKKVDTNKKLVIAGGSSDTDEFMSELKKMAKGDDRIIFTGFVQGQLLEELYSNAYIYTLPSDLEGMPLSLLEAMSYGNCCLVSDIAECTEVVEDKAVVFKKSNVDDLKEKMQFLCNYPKEVTKIKASVSQFVQKKFSWKKIVEMTLEIYKLSGDRYNAETR